MYPCSTPAGPQHHSQTSGDKNGNGRRKNVCSEEHMLFTVSGVSRGDVKERGALREMK